MYVHVASKYIYGIQKFTTTSATTKAADNSKGHKSDAVVGVVEKNLPLK